MSMHSDDYGPVYDGRFGDGKSAAAAAAEVELTERGIEIRRKEPAEVVFWPYGGLTVSAPIGPHAIDVLLGYKYDPDATLFVAEGSFARRIAALAPHLTQRSTRWRHAAPWLWTAAGVAAVAAGVWAMDLSPARAVARLLPDSTRAALGAQVVGSMTAGKKVCAAAPGRAALDTLTARLGTATGSRRPFKIVVVDWGLVNAFAAPGEQIVLTRGLIEKAQGADEVSGVIAHEMGHGLEMHPEAGIVRAIGMSAAVELMLGGSGGTLANIGLVLAQLSYTRSAEREADAHAIRILRESEIGLGGLAEFFRRIAREEDGGKKPAGGGGAFDVLRTHPQSTERARLVASQPSYPSRPALTAGEWTALRAICGPRAPT